MLSLIISLSVHAGEQEFHGYLTSGDGLCTIKLQKQNDFYYQLILISPELNLKASNLELSRGAFTKFSEVFERDGDQYLQLTFAMPYPRLYQISMKNLGRGQFQIEKTTLVFGKKTLSKRDICITQYP